MCEGLYYTFLVFGLALAQNTITGIFWFFTYRFTVTPILLLAPVFALLGVVVPLVVYRSVNQQQCRRTMGEVKNIQSNWVEKNSGANEAYYWRAYDIQLYI